MFGKKEPAPDGRPTMAEWPVRIWDCTEIPEGWKTETESWIKAHFDSYEFVYAPKRRTDPRAFAYLFGYGEDSVVYWRMEETVDAEGTVKTTAVKTEVNRTQFRAAATERELLNAAVILEYEENGETKSLRFPYVPSTYYLYDPFLNWILGIAKDFTPALAEKENPRPESLYRESLVMFNYSLAAYRLGNGFDTYRYRFEQRRRKWMPWKKILEEWLEVSMERGRFELHSMGYLTECRYLLSPETSA